MVVGVHSSQFADESSDLGMSSDELLHRQGPSESCAMPGGGTAPGSAPAPSAESAWVTNLASVAATINAARPRKANSQRRLQECCTYVPFAAVQLQSRP